MQHIALPRCVCFVQIECPCCCEMSGISFNSRKLNFPVRLLSGLCQWEAGQLELLSICFESGNFLGADQ